MDRQRNRDEIRRQCDIRSPRQSCYQRHLAGQRTSIVVEKNRFIANIFLTANYVSQIFKDITNNKSEQPKTKGDRWLIFSLVNKY